MRIIQFAREDFAGVGIKIQEALTRAGHHCRMVCPVDNYFRYGKDFRSTTPEVLRLLGKADVVICHVHTRALTGGWGNTKRRFLYVHGTNFRRNPQLAMIAARRSKARIVCSTIDLTRHADGMIYNPTPIDVTRLSKMWRPPVRGPLVVGHSPTSRRGKGTAQLIAACAELDGVQLEIIEGVDNATCLARKARCHILFDSIAIGMQVSGLEAIAMGMPVLAGGDRFVLDGIRERYDTQPYLWVRGKDSIRKQIARLRDDAAYYGTWQRRAVAYARDVHSYEAAATTMIGWMTK